MVYTLAFIKYKDEILLVNREKQPWLGCWNGLGGKIEVGETKEETMVRELFEESGIKVTKDQLRYKGKMTWNTSTDFLYMFLVELDYKITVPVMTKEGILDYKRIEWLLDHNLGVAHNIPYFLETVLYDKQVYNYHCTFKGDLLLSVTKEGV